MAMPFVFFVLGYAASLISALLPFAAFEVTRNWHKVWDGFGPSSMIIDLVASVLKLSVFLFALKDKAAEVHDSTSSLYISICFTSAALFVYLSGLRRRGLLQNLLAPSIWLGCAFVFALTLLAVGTKLKWGMSRRKVGAFAVVQICLLVVQNFLPLILRLVHHNFKDDEPVVYKFKLVATVLNSFTSLMDFWNFMEEELNVPMWTVRSLSGASAGLNVLQIGLRVIGPQKIADFFSDMSYTAQHLFVSIYRPSTAEPLSAEDLKQLREDQEHDAYDTMLSEAAIDLRDRQILRHRRLRHLQSRLAYEQSHPPLLAPVRRPSSLRQPDLEMQPVARADPIAALLAAPLPALEEVPAAVANEEEIPAAAAGEEEVAAAVAGEEDLPAPVADEVPAHDANGEPPLDQELQPLAGADVPVAAGAIAGEEEAPAPVADEEELPAPVADEEELPAPVADEEVPAHDANGEPPLDQELQPLAGADVPVAAGAIAGEEETPAPLADEEELPAPVADQEELPAPVADEEVPANNANGEPPLNQELQPLAGADVPVAAGAIAARVAFFLREAARVAGQEELPGPPVAAQVGLPPVARDEFHDANGEP